MAVTGLSPELVSDAQRVLEQAGYMHGEIIDVQPDCILYLNRARQPRTLWLSRQPGTGRLRTMMVNGFQAWPPEGWGD